jgi:hypothetical protein
MARREHQIVLEKMQKQNRGLIDAIQRRGGQQLDEKERIIRQQTQAGGALLQEGHELARKANVMQAQKNLRISRLQEGMGREGLRAQRAEERVGQLTQEGRSLEAKGKQQVRGLQEGMGRQGLRAQRAEEEASGLRGALRLQKEARGRQGIRAQRAEERVGQLLQEGRGLETEHKQALRGRDINYDALKAEANPEPGKEDQRRLCRPHGRSDRNRQPDQAAGRGERAT